MSEEIPESTAAPAPAPAEPTKAKTAAESAKAAAGSAKAAAGKVAAAASARYNAFKADTRTSAFDKLFVVVFVVVLVGMSAVRIFFAMSFPGSDSSDKNEVTSAMEVDRVFGWMLGPLMAIVAGFMAKDIDDRKSRGRMFLGGVVAAIILLCTPSFFTQYLSSWKSGDLEGAKARKDKSLLLYRIMESGFVVIVVAVLVRWWWRTLGAQAEMSRPEAPAAEA